MLAGLYGCRDAPDGTVLAYAEPDIRQELADWIAHEAGEARLHLPPQQVEAACPDWAPLGG